MISLSPAQFAAIITGYRRIRHTGTHQERQVTAAVKTGQGDYAAEFCEGVDRRLDFSTLINESASAYHGKARKFLTSHSLRAFRSSPALYKHLFDRGFQTEKTDAMLIGEALHTLVLEGAGVYGQRYTSAAPVNPKTGKPFGATSDVYKQWAANEPRDILTPAQAELIQAMAAAVVAHPSFGRIFDEGYSEGVVRASVIDHPCQARIDWISAAPEIGLVDLKTCRSLDTFERDAVAYGYVHQLAFYKDVYSESAYPDERPPFACHIVAVEKEEPHRVGVWLVSFNSLDKARRENWAAMRRLASCWRCGVWPTEYEYTRVLNY